MNSIDAFERDIGLQPDFLKSFRRQKPFTAELQKKMIFSGSGDSLVASLMAESFSNGLVRAMDPLDLYRNRSIAKSRHVCFVSVSGNTITNIRVARIAKKATAITANPGSRLAEASSGLVSLVAPNCGVFTAGSISFLESMLTCISMVSRFSLVKPDRLFDNAKESARKCRMSSRVFVLGNKDTFPIAMYCAAKFYEVMGHDVHYSRLEQFSHMELFSAKRGDTVVIFEEKNPHTIQLAKNLQEIGINVVHPDIPHSRISQVVFCTFFSQFLALNEAKRRKKRECHFVTAKKIRNVSNLMIY